MACSKPLPQILKAASVCDRPMLEIISFIQIIVQSLLGILVWLVIINAIMSWLVAFGVINLRNRIGYEVVRGLDRATEPLLRPLRRFIPPLGGMDITPVIFIIVVQAANSTVIPGVFNWIRGMVAPQLGTPL